MWSKMFASWISMNSPEKISVIPENTLKNFATLQLQVENFTNYHLYYETYKFDIRDNGICDKNMIYNQTEMYFSSSIKYCQRREYSISFIPAKQLSWKSTPPVTNSNSISNGTQESNNSTISAKKPQQVVYPYLAIVVLLPSRKISLNV